MYKFGKVGKVDKVAKLVALIISIGLLVYRPAVG